MKIILEESDVRRVAELGDMGFHIEWRNHYLALVRVETGKDVAVISFLWEKDVLTYDDMLPYAQKWISELLTGEGGE